MSEEDFRLPQSSYEFLAQIIAAYGEFDRPASTAEVADLINTHRTQVSRNNAFLMSVGIVESGKKKTPTEHGRELARAIHWEREADIQRLWRQLLKGNDFIEKILTAVKVRRGMERSNLESHIAYTAGETKTNKVLTGASTLVDILLTAGFVEEQNGKLVVSGQGAEEAEADEAHAKRPERENLSRWISRGDVQVERKTRVADVVLQIQVQCKPEDLEDLAPQLRKLMDELSGAAVEAPEQE